MIFFLLYLLSWMIWSLLIDSNMPLNPSTRDWISQSAAKHKPVFFCCFSSGPREITLGIQKGAFPYRNVLSTYFFLFRVISLVQGKSLLGFKKGRFPYINVLRTSSLGLKCKQKHDLLLGVVYPFNLNLVKPSITLSA